MQVRQPRQLKYKGHRIIEQEYNNLFGYCFDVYYNDEKLPMVCSSVAESKRYINKHISDLNWSGRN